MLLRHALVAATVGLCAAASQSLAQNPDPRPEPAPRVRVRDFGPWDFHVPRMRFRMESRPRVDTERISRAIERAMDLRHRTDSRIRERMEQAFRRRAEMRSMPRSRFNFDFNFDSRRFERMDRDLRERLERFPMRGHSRRHSRPI
ncbi:MAG: hypothetical protein HOP28_10210 [Gemmatimonadales bacterium]|nr:hypothetical protein [Gemmatimonadales bacterium]